MPEQNDSMSDAEIDAIVEEAVAKMEDETPSVRYVASVTPGESGAEFGVYAIVSTTDSEGNPLQHKLVAISGMDRETTEHLHEQLGNALAFYRG